MPGRSRSAGHRGGPLRREAPAWLMLGAAAGRSGRRYARRAMAFRVLPAAEAFWRPSNQMGLMNTDLAKQLDAATLGARLWRLKPGQASTRHRHMRQDEMYVLLDGRVRVGCELLTLEPLSALYVEADTVR
jgi:quercetin dioxygenase-like cupin family protein